MALVILLCAVSLLHSCEAQEPRAETPVFVKKGEDVFLNVTIANVNDTDLVFWRFKKSVNLVRFDAAAKPTIFSGYSGRIEVLEKYSVKLKNLQEADSGVYAAVLSGSEDKQITGYKITVQDPVSPVILSVDSVSSSSVWCNLTVSCRAQDSHINSTFRCDTHTCSQEGGERQQVTPSASALHVYLSNGSIICNHSNQVSWTKDMKTIKTLCQHDGHDPSTNAISVGAGVGIGILLFLCVAALVAAAFCYHQKKGQDTREIRENTVYEVPQVLPTALTQSSTVEGLSPTSTYCLVGPHTASLDSRPTLPESLYAQVDKPGRILNK
ncbi:uncharacterized protein LOC116677344 [Etheostoma spectabile]|uniref:uncharacterized protein LOC116677344 n=1 Tax=Etheostoma spectabile TaxID=54343 RepID=UPI0013AFCB8D|nr:uncharacterized protein LOC116677344 [Etheostoma spectabile]